MTLRGDPKAVGTAHSDGSEWRSEINGLKFCFVLYVADIDLSTVLFY